MALNREVIFAALFARLQTALSGTIKNFSRAFVSWDDTPPAVQPALLLLKGEERTKQRERVNTPKIWMLAAEIWVYVQDDGTNEAVPSIQINNIIQLIEAALEMQPTEAAAAGAQYIVRRDAPPAPTSLGGLCLSCEIVDPILIDEGPQGHVGVVRIPVEIVATA